MYIYIYIYIYIYVHSWCIFMYTYIHKRSPTSIPCEFYNRVDSSALCVRVRDVFWMHYYDIIVLI